MAHFSFFSVAALATAVTTSMPAAAQSSRTASASMRVPAVATIRSVSAPSARTVVPGRLELVHEVTTASNVDYLMTVVGLTELSELERRGIRVSVQTTTGGFLPVRAGVPIAAARGRRGMCTVTEVIVRVDGVPRRARERVREQLRALLALQATVETSSGAQVLSEAKLPAAED